MGATLGTLTVSLATNTAGFTRGMTKAERASQRWRKNVKRDIDSVAKQMRRLSLVAVSGLVSSFYAVVAASARQADAVRQLETRLKSTGGAAGKSSEELQKMAAALQGVTRFGDEAIIEMQSVLLTFTNIRGEIFDRTVPAILDLSTAMGQGLQQSALQLGKALNDPAKGLAALSRVGIQFSEDQKAVIESLVEAGQKTHAQTVILQELETQFGGSARAAGDTFAGALAQVKNAFGDLLENPSGLEANKEVLQELTTFLQDPETVEMAKHLTGALIKGFTGVAKMVKETVGLFRFLGEEFAALTVGVAPDDLPRLESKLERLNNRLNNLPIFLGDSPEKINAEIKKVEALIAAEKKAIADREKILRGAGRSLQQTLPSPLSSAKPAPRPPIPSSDDNESKSIESTIRSLEMQALALQHSEDFIADYTLQLAGATQAQRAYAAELRETIRTLEGDRVALDAFQAAQDAVNRETESIRQSLMTQEELIQESYNRRREIVLKSTSITGTARQELLDRLEQDTQDQLAQREQALLGAFSAAPRFNGLDAVVGGPASELSRVEASRAEMEDWYQEQLERLAQFRAERADLTQLWDEQEVALAREREDRLAQIEQARQVASLAAVETTFGELAGLARQFGGEQSAAYQALFAIEKAAAIARSIIAIQTAMAQAAAAGPFPANLAAMASVASATAGLVSTIASTTFQGQAHDGLMSVPKTGTYLLEKGERITTAETSAKMDGLIDEARGGANIRIVNAWDTAMIGDYLGSRDGERVVMNIVRQNQRTVQALAAV